MNRNLSISKVLTAFFLLSATIVQTSLPMQKIQNAHDKTVTKVLISKDGKKMFSASEDGTIKIWKLGTFEDPTVLKGHKKEVPSLALSEDEKFLVSGSRDETVKVWSLEDENYECVKTLEGHRFTVNHLCIKKTTVYSGSLNNIKIWNILTGRCIKTLENKSQINSLDISKDGYLIASGDDNYQIRLFRIKTLKDFFKLDKTINKDDRNLPIWKRTSRGHVNSIIITQGDKNIITASSDGKIKFWDIDKGECIKDFTAHEGGIKCLTLSKCGKYIVSAGRKDKTIKIWNIKTLKCVETIKLSYASNTLAVNEKNIVSGDRRGNIIIFTDKIPNK